MKVIPVESMTPFRPLDFIRNLRNIAEYTSTEKLILVLLAMHANKVGHAFPGVEKLAIEASTSVRTIKATLKSLEKKEAIKKIAKHGYRGLHNVYQIVYASTSNEALEATTDTSTDTPSATIIRKVKQIASDVAIEISEDELNESLSDDIVDDSEDNQHVKTNGFLPPKAPPPVRSKEKTMNYLIQMRKLGVGIEIIMDGAKRHNLTDEEIKEVMEAELQ